MGWSGATPVIEAFWDKARKYIPAKKRAELLAALIDACKDQDYDCAGELQDYWPEANDALRMTGDLEDNDYEDQEY